MKITKIELRKLVEAKLNESVTLDKFQDMAIRLYDAMDGMGTDEDEVSEIFKYMNREVNTLMKVSYLYGVISRGGSLYEDLLSDMSKGAIQQNIERVFPNAIEFLKR